jgi:hypothetical protein
MPIGLGAALLGSAAISAGGSLLGGLFGGKKPKVPELKPINFEQEQTNAIRQNIAALEPATKLAEKTTAAEQSLLETQLRRAIPGYDQLISQAGKNIGSALRGELSPEVSAQVQRSTAGRALAGGFGAGSGFGRSLTARDLGLTSMQLQNQGLAQAQNFIQQQRAFGMAQPFSVSSMFITPAQRIGAIQQQQSAQYGRDLTAAQVAAAPSPFQQSVGTALSNVGNIAGGALMQYGMYNAMMANSPMAYGTTPGGAPSVSSTTVDYSTGETAYPNPMSPATLYAVPPSSYYPGIR